MATCTREHAAEQPQLTKLTANLFCKLWAALADWERICSETYSSPFSWRKAYLLTLWPLSTCKCHSARSSCGLLQGFRWASSPEQKERLNSSQPVVGPCICSSDTDVNFCKQKLTPKFQRRLLKKQIDFFFRVSLLSSGARWTWYALQGPNRNLAKRFSFLYASFPLMSLSRRAAVLHSLFGRNYSYPMLRTSTHPSLFIHLPQWHSSEEGFLKLYFGQPGAFECLHSKRDEFITLQHLYRSLCCLFTWKLRQRHSDALSAP